MKITINERAIAQVKEKLYQGLEETAFILGRQFTQEITDSQWYWPRGESPRDIVDTGRLRAALQIIKYKESHKVRLSYPVEYAAAVHEGAVYRTGAVMPARPWTRVALAKLDLAEIMQMVTEV